MIAFGVPLGANKPIDCCEIMPGSPASTAVGMSGAAIRRVGLVTARMRSLPVRLNSSNGPVTAGVTIATCPLMVSAVAGPASRYGHAPLVFPDHGAEHRLQLLRAGAPDGVVPAARREGNHEPDRTVGIFGLSTGGLQRQRPRRQRGRAQSEEIASPHDGPVVWLVLELQWLARIRTAARRL